MITEENFETAWKMFVYLFSDMRSIWKQSLILFKEAAFTPTSLRRLLLLISNYEPRDYLEVTAKRLFLSIFANDIGFELQNIDELKLPPTSDTDVQYLHRITNHPVHIFDEKGNLSPSAFIPFCQFGRNISTL